MRILAIIALGLLQLGATGSEIHPLYKLKWSNPNEVASYRSCGCADDCWQAEVRDRKTKQLIARLRCDCEKMFSIAAGSKSERAFSETCVAYHNGEKFEMITNSLKRLAKKRSTSTK